MKRHGFLLPLLALLSMLLLPAAAGAAGSVTPSGLKRLRETEPGLLLIDVRSAKMFAGRHIAGAMNIPAFAVDRKPLPKDSRIVLYDAGIGSLDARNAADRLTAAGFSDVSVLQGGLALWEGASLPVQAKGGVLDLPLVEPLTVEELAQAKRDGLELTVVDLRQAAAAASIPEARQIVPAALLREAAGWRRDLPVVLVDDADGIAERQGELLRRAGFRLIRYLYGGFPEWKRQNAS